MFGSYMDLYNSMTNVMQPVLLCWGSLLSDLCKQQVSTSALVGLNSDNMDDWDAFCRFCFEITSQSTNCREMWRKDRIENFFMSMNHVGLKLISCLSRFLKRWQQREHIHQEIPQRTWTFKSVWSKNSTPVFFIWWLNELYVTSRKKSWVITAMSLGITFLYMFVYI